LLPGNVIGLVLTFLLTKPFSAVLLSFEVRFFLWMQQATKLSYWWSVAIFLPLFLFLDNILDYRNFFLYNLGTMIVMACGGRNLNQLTNSGIFTTQALYEVEMARPCVLRWRPFWGLLKQNF